MQDQGAGEFAKIINPEVNSYVLELAVGKAIAAISGSSKRFIF